jgi:hypothetical protein
VGAMNESALERLRQEVKEKEVEKKTEAFKREHIEKKNVTSSINCSDLCITTCFTCTYSRRN